MKKQSWLWLALVPILGAVFYTFHRAEQGEILMVAPAMSLPRYSVSDATLVRYDTDGNPTLRATASRIDYFDDDSGQATQLHADLVSEGEVPWQLDAPQASMPAHDRRILLDGPVVAHGAWPDTGTPLTVDTSKVWIDADAHQFETREPVTLDSPARQGTAVGMRVDWQERRLQLLHRVKMVYAATP